ncbi:hypothetical protein [Ottowia sp.]|uniref:hypothetical protein n=1 Tax=Ottowia sp. TaxID=1898956 RepID=UPI002BE79B27|nr:hypothetical protein [Ottowia sp.]HRN77562.1 hypothetical protein [Ottowia sp.]HRQ02268.1 hypothetical protein [Ottowia sp.]
MKRINLTALAIAAGMALSPSVMAQAAQNTTTVDPKPPSQPQPGQYNPAGPTAAPAAPSPAAAPAPATRSTSPNRATRAPRPDRN